LAGSFKPDIAPVLDSLALSALIAALPLITVFVTLGWLRWKAHWAGLAAARGRDPRRRLAFGMPVGLAALAATQGAVFGLFPIMWIVFTAIVLYEVTVASGRFEDLRATCSTSSRTTRASRRSSSPSASAASSRRSPASARPSRSPASCSWPVGFSPMRAATVVLLANTAPVAFGAIGIPIITAGNLTGIPYTADRCLRRPPDPDHGLHRAAAPRAHGRRSRGVRQTWPMALVVGLTFAVAQWISATWISVELTDIISSLAGLAVVVIMLRFWHPQGRDEVRADLRRAYVAEREEAGLPVEPEHGHAHAAVGGGAATATATRQQSMASAAAAERLTVTAGKASAWRCSRTSWSSPSSPSPSWSPR
jgi:lactate permease